MSNIVKFKINGLSSALNNVYTRVTDLSRVELFEGETLVSDSLGNVELDIGAAGSVGQGVIVYGDNYSTGNESTFKSFCGHSAIEAGFVVRDYKNFLAVGASLTEYSFEKSDRINTISATILARDYGVSVAGYHSAKVGNTSAQIKTDLTAWVAANDAALVGDKLAFLHSGGNDVTSKRPYSSATDTAGGYDTVRADISDTLDILLNAGWDVVYSGVTYRAYTNPDVPPESNGSLPFNDNVFLPIGASKSLSAAYNGSNPKLDVYNFVKRYPEMLADGIHLFNNHEVTFNAYITARIGEIITSAAPYTWGGNKFIFGFGAEGEATETATITLVNGIGRGSTSSAYIPDQTGKITPAYTFRGGAAAVRYAAYQGGPANSTYTLNNAIITSNYIASTDDVNFTKQFIHLGGDAANKAGRIRFLAWRKNTTAGERITEIKVNSGSILEMDNGGATAIPSAWIEFIADSDGSMIIEWKKKLATVGPNASLNGFEVEIY